jgi:hypothetical protein
MPTTLLRRKWCRVPTDFRKQINDRLKKLGKSRYWLAEQVDGMPSESAIYSYLNAKPNAKRTSDMGSENLARLLDVLDAEEKRQAK